MYTWIFKRLEYFDPFGCLPILVEVAYFFWEIGKNECFNIFFPSPSDVSSISWGCTVVHWGWVCGSDSATPPTFSCSEHVCTESAKSKQKNKGPKRPAKIPQKIRKTPAKTRKSPQIQKTGCLACFYTVASFDVVFARHLDKFQKELLVIV